MMNENSALICRTCLSQTGETSGVFTVVNYLEVSAQISDVLMACATVEVYRGDGLPEQVCMQCLQELWRAFIFRKLCEKSDATLRSYLLQESTATEKFDAETENTDGFLMEQTNSIASEIEGKQELFKEKTDVQLSSDTYFADPSNGLEQANGNKTDYTRNIPQAEKLNEDCTELKGNLQNIRDDSGEIEKRKKNSYKCEICGATCFGLSGYRRHMADKHGQHFKCDTCDKSFITKTMLDRHTKTHTIPEGDENEETEKKERNEKKSITTKKKNLPRTCSICNKTFRFHSNLVRHTLIHTGEKPFLCNVCGKGFGQLSYLKIHSFIHTGEKPYKCDMCEKSFSAPGTLMTHKRTHTGERPYVCRICGKDFPQSGYLSAHIRTHTGEKPMECKVCHRRFNQSGRLGVHMRIHSGEKPFQCKDCGRKFAVKGTLKKHMRTHTGERPYVCSVCGQSFAQSGTLMTHMKVHKSNV